MSKDLKIWIVVVLIYIGLVIGVISFTGFFESPKISISNLPNVSNSVTPIDYRLVEYDFISFEEILGVNLDG